MSKTFNMIIKSRCANFKSSIDATNKYIHDTVMMVMRHAEKHNDCSLAQYVVMELPASYRREALITWFATFSPIVVKNDPKWNAKAWKPSDKKFVPYDIEAADKKPFWKIAEEVKEEKPQASLTLDQMLKMVETLKGKIEKASKDENIDVFTRRAAESILIQLETVKPVENPAPANDVVTEPKALAAG